MMRHSFGFAPTAVMLNRSPVLVRRNLAIWDVAIYCTLVVPNIVMVSLAAPWLRNHGDRRIRTRGVQWGGSFCKDK
jgi:hypothetical protein